MHFTSQMHFLLRKRPPASGGLRSQIPYWGFAPGKHRPPYPGVWSPKNSIN